MARKKKKLELRPVWAIYTPTSDPQVQAPERSQGAQRLLIQDNLIRPSKLPLIREYADEESGASQSRKGWLRLKSDAKKGLFSHLGIAFADRRGRYDVKDMEAVDELVELGVTVRFASHPHLNPADEYDRFNLLLQMGIATSERRRIVSQTMAGMEEKLLSGGWPWRAPVGYRNMEDRLTAADGDSMNRENVRYRRLIELDPKQAEMVRLIFDLLLKGCTYKNICHELHIRGYTMPSGRVFYEQSNGHMSIARSTINRIATNWFYAGWVAVDTEHFHVLPKTIQGHWEPIVTTQEFERVQTILTEINRKPGSQNK